MKRLIFALLLLASGRLQAQPDYVVDIVGSVVSARPTRGLPPFAGSDAYTVIQSCIRVLQTGKGGEICLSSGQYSLSDEPTITGWGTTLPPNEQIKLTGAGYATQLIQNTPGKNGIVIKNRASVVLKDLYIYAGPMAKSALLLDNAGSDSEISLWGGTIENVFLQSSSSSAPAFYGKNYFDVHAAHVQAISSASDGMKLENISKTTNYGNSAFSFLRLGAGPGFAALRLVGDVDHPMNLNHFSNLNTIGAGTYGIYLDGACFNTFGLVDLESIPYPIVLTGSVNRQAQGNVVSSGYLLTAGNNPVAIQTNMWCSGNSVSVNVQASPADQILRDLTPNYLAPNAFDLVIFGASDESKITSVHSGTRLTYRLHNTGKMVIRPTR